MIAISPRRNITDLKSLTHLIENLIEKLFCINAFIKTFIKSNLQRKNEGFQINCILISKINLIVEKKRKSSFHWVEAWS